MANTKYMTVGELRRELDRFGDDCPVAIGDAYIVDVGRRERPAVGVHPTLICRTDERSDSFKQVERWMVDYEHGEGEPQHTVLSWLDNEARGLPDVGEYLIRESDGLRVALVLLNKCGDWFRENNPGETLPFWAATNALIQEIAVRTGTDIQSVVNSMKATDAQG